MKIDYYCPKATNGIEPFMYHKLQNAKKQTPRSHFGSLRDCNVESFKNVCLLIVCVNLSGKVALGDLYRFASLDGFGNALYDAEHKE